MPTDQEIAELTRLARELVERIDTLVGGTGEQIVTLAQSAKRNQQLIKVLWAGFAVVMALAVTMVIGFMSINKVANTVDERQELARVEVLCPLYGAFVRADTPAARERAEARGEDMAARDIAFADIRHAYDVLQCEEKQ